MNAAGELLCNHLLGDALGKAGQHHGAIQRLYADGRRIDLRVLDEAALDPGGDGGVVDIGAYGLLATLDSAACNGGKGQCSDDGGEKGADVHGESPLE